MAKESEVSIKHFLKGLVIWIKYFFRNWLIIVASAILGVIIGFGVYFFSKPKFEAESNFVLATSESNGPNIGAALGFGSNSSAGLFSSIENIIWLYKSEHLIRQTLFTKIGNSDRFLITEFIETSKKAEDYRNKKPSLKGPIFKDREKMSADEIRFLKFCVETIRSKYIEVASVGKTENIANVKVAAESELFAYHFVNKLMQNVNEFYVKTKTQQALENVNRLKTVVDSLRRGFGNNMAAVATSIDDVPYANPNRNILMVRAQKGNVETQATTAIYLQSVQNLEVARNDLAKQTPIIQTVDAPVLPLPVKGLGIFFAIVVATAICLFLCLGILFLRKIWNELPE